MPDFPEIPQKKSKIPYFFFVFFGVIFAVNIFYIYLSKQTWRGLATQDSYQKGLQYNQTLKQAQKQKELGWTINIEPTRITSQVIDLKIKIQDHAGADIKDAKVFIEFRRPTQEGSDFTKDIPSNDDIYRSEIKFPLPGQWDFAISITKGKDSYKEVKRYAIQ